MANEEGAVTTDSLEGTVEHLLEVVRCWPTDESEGSAGGGAMLCSQDDDAV